MTKKTFEFPESVLAPNDIKGKERFASGRQPQMYGEKFDIIRECGRVYRILEIGVRAGYSLYTWLAAYPKARALGIDADNGTHGGQGGPWLPHAEVLFKDNDRVTLLRADTQAMTTLPLIDEKRYDFIYVDGNHSADGVYHDMTLAWAALKPGGMMLVDDYKHLDTVRQGVNHWIERNAARRVLEEPEVPMRDTLRGDLVFIKPKTPFEQRYFVITGTGRCGTQWLARMLKQHPDCYCRWEPFRPQGWPYRFDDWRNVQKPVVGMASVFSRFFVREIEDAVHPQWAMVWRDPIEVTWSQMQRITGRALRELAEYIWGGQEAVLRQMEQRGIETQHWAFEHIVKGRGFAGFAASLGLDHPWEHLPPANTAEQNLRDLQHIKPYPKPEQWAPADRAHIRDLVSSLPRVSAAYAEAHERMIGAE